mmetsp:Transcript_15303/g.40393  ORF Transcript_15303/g.40393 Transcript_15303/m.40393 type:complete len:238 (-) Transcript_15303:86-799(-)
MRCKMGRRAGERQTPAAFAWGERRRRASSTNKGGTIVAVGARRRDINKSAVLPALEEVRRVQAVRAEAADDDLDAVDHPVDDARRRGVALRPDAGEKSEALRPAQLPHDRRRLVRRREARERLEEARRRVGRREVEGPAPDGERVPLDLDGHRGHVLRRLELPDAPGRRAGRRLGERHARGHEALDALPGAHLVKEGRERGLPEPRRAEARGWRAGAAHVDHGSGGGGQPGQRTLFI